MRCLFIREKGSDSDVPNIVIFVSSDVLDVYRLKELPLDIDITEILFDDTCSVEGTREKMKIMHGDKLE